MPRYSYDSDSKTLLLVSGAGNTGNSGHIIKNSSGTAMAERGNLKFVGLDVTDNSNGDETIVSYDNTNFVGTLDDWDLLSSAEKAQYRTIDILEDDEEISDELISGHNIVTDQGIEMSGRENLKFVNASITDDFQNNATVVTVEKTQYSSIPTASTAWVDKIIQYTGPTINSNISGYFYKCVSYIDSQDNTAYRWDPISVQTSNSESMLAPIENDSSSSVKAYSVGDQVIIDGVLYDVTDDISIGDELVEGTNIEEAESITDQINSKQDALTFDDTPTANSTNPITSGAVYNYIDTMITQAVTDSY